MTPTMTALVERAREAAASVFEADEQFAIAESIRAGREDHMSQVQAALAAPRQPGAEYRRGVEDAASECDAYARGPRWQKVHGEAMATAIRALDSIPEK